VQAEQSKKRRNRLDKIAVRLVCLMFAYAICSSLVYVPICVASRDKNRLTYHLKKYIGCLMFFPAEFCEKSRGEADFLMMIFMMVMVFVKTANMCLS